MADVPPPRRASTASTREASSTAAAVAAPAVDDQVIDVGSLGPALLPSSPAPAYVPTRRGSRALPLSAAAKADSEGVSTMEGDQETPHEHQYPRGRRQVPMESPGDELLPDLQLDEDEISIGEGDASIASGANHHARLPRLMRNRVFFQSDDIPRSYRYRSSGGVLQRITLRRRRKRGPHDWFWTAIAITTLLSLSLLICVVIYLMQTDFFALHQSELLGTTVDNRFTVVSQQDASAKIYLKSGHSKSQLSEAMIAFADGELRLGRRALEASELQSFFGLSLFTNGTASFTNWVEAPTIATEYLHATKAVVFEDGTVMTTAANMSGGVKEVGDLNLVSQSGSVVASAGGKPLLVVDPSGSVIISDPDAEDPTASGIQLDGAKGSVSIADDFLIHHDGNTSSVSTPLELHLISNGVVLGSSKGSKVTLTVAENSEEEAANEAEGTTRRGLADAGATNSEATTAESESVTLEVVGQSSSTQKEGGDVQIAGGDGLEIGGDVVLVGGASTDTTPVEYGTISLNSNLEETSSSLTEIGSHSSTHAVNLHGLISLNRKASGTFDNTTTVRIAGGLFNVSAQRITFNNSAIAGAKLRMNSKDIRIGTMGTPLIKVGALSHSDVTLEGRDFDIDASDDLTIGTQATVVSIGKANREGQSVKVASEAIVLDASKSLSIHPTSIDAKTTVRGQVFLRGNATTKAVPMMAVADNTVSLNAPSVRIGEAGQTTGVSIESTHISIGEPEVNGSLVTGKVEITSADIDIGSEDSDVAMHGSTVTINAEDSVAIGESAKSVVLGSDEAGKVTLHKGAVDVSGAITVGGASFDIDSATVVIGKNATTDIAIGSATAKFVTVSGQSLSIGTSATAVTIGSRSEDVTIGSAESAINLLGKVTVNGEDIASRRRLASIGATKAFGYLNTRYFGLPIKPGRAQFAIPFEDGFASEPGSFQIDTETSRFLSVAVGGSSVDSNGGVSGHVRLSLDIARLRLQVSAEASSASTSTKMRCSVFRHRQSSADVEAVLEASGPIEHCSGSDCQDGIFGGLAAQRLVRLGPGESYSTRCVVVAATGGELLGNDVQLSFTEL